MKIKKIITGILACAMVCSAVPYVNYAVPENSAITASAEDYTEGTYENLKYYKYSDYIEISGYDESATEVVIPNEIEGLPVTSIRYQAFANCSGLTSITIPESVTSIGLGAFYNCSGLITVEKNNPNYADIDGVLFNKDFSEIISYPAGKKETSYNIPNSVTSIGYGAFYNRPGLTSITIPDSVTSIGSSTFAGCSNLTSITIPNSVTSIGAEAFYGCINLTSITIPENVTSIGSGAFAATDWYNNQPDGLIYAGKVAYEYKGEMPENTEIVLKDDTISITDSAFYYCYNLTSITIPDSVTSIGSEAFSGCTGLISITIPDSVTSIGYEAFYDTEWYNNQPDGLIYAGKVAYEYKGEMPENTEIVLKDDTVGIASEAFSGCTGLTSITIPKSVTSIKAWTFSGCKGLTSITIPDSVKSIEIGAFDCTGLTSITIENSECEIDDDSYTISDTATIYGYNNSTAQSYAEKYNRTFISLGDALSVSFGDINGDGKIDASDASDILADYAKSSAGGVSEIDSGIGDINKDGKIDSSDASDVLAYYAYTSSGGTDTLEKFVSTGA